MAEEIVAEGKEKVPFRTFLKQNKVIFLCIGVCALFVAIGVYLLFQGTDGLVATEATISEITVDHTFDDDDRDAYVDYTANGVAYSHVRLDYYSSSFYEGKKITVYYDPSDPGRITAGKDPLLGILLICFSAPIGVFLLIRTILTYKRGGKSVGPLVVGKAKGRDAESTWIK